MDARNASKSISALLLSTLSLVSVSQSPKLPTTESPPERILHPRRRPHHPRTVRLPAQRPIKFTVGDFPIDPATHQTLWAEPSFDDSAWETVDLTPPPRNPAARATSRRFPGAATASALRSREQSPRVRQRHPPSKQPPHRPSLVRWTYPLLRLFQHLAFGLFHGERFSFRVVPCY